MPQKDSPELFKFVNDDKRTWCGYSENICVALHENSQLNKQETSKEDVQQKQ